MSITYPWDQETKKIRQIPVVILYDEFSWLFFIYIEPKCESRSYFRSFVNH